VTLRGGQHHAKASYSGGWERGKRQERAFVWVVVAAAKTNTNEEWRYLGKRSFLARVEDKMSF